MKNVIKLATAGVLTLVAATATAGGISSGTVSNVVVLADQNRIFFSANSITPHTNKPACASATVGSWAFDSSTSGGKAMYAGILTAQATGAEIVVEGFGTADCNAWGDRETARYFYFVE